jgi:hypothetical protein
MEPFEAYKIYTAISLHFSSSSYDYFKYRGSVKTSRDKFEMRNDKYFYHKLAKIEDLELFLANAFLRESKIWIGNIFDAKYLLYHAEALKRQQSLEYIFKTEMSKFDSLNDCLNVNGDNYPVALTCYKRHEVSPETLVILNGVLSVFDYWSGAMSDKIVWPKIKQSLVKYSGFVKYDKTKYNQVLLDMFSDT